MNAQYLDKVLTQINNARNGEVRNVFPDDLYKTDLISAINFLDAKGYIGQAKYSESDLSHWSVSIKEEGQVFLGSGGFSHEQRLKDSPLDANRIAAESNRIAKHSRTIAWIAIIISAVVAVAVAWFEFQSKAK